MFCPLQTVCMALSRVPGELPQRAMMPILTVRRFKLIQDETGSPESGEITDRWDLSNAHDLQI